MRLFKKRETESTKMSDHDFTRMVKDARKDPEHFQKIQTSFAKLKKTGHSSSKKQQSRKG